MTFSVTILALSVGLFVGMLALVELGRRLGRPRFERDPEGARAGVAAAEGAVFALLGLLIAFTFSGAASRFERRRELITTEANAIGSAWRFLDLMPTAAQPVMRTAFRAYVDARLAGYLALPDLEAAMRELERATVLEAELWQQVVACRGASEQGWEKHVFPALNAMSDIASERTQTASRHPPMIVFALLFALALGCALLAGYALPPGIHPPRVHIAGFAAIVALTVGVILDLEYPRLGLIRVDSSDQALLDLRAEMK